MTKPAYAYYVLLMLTLCYVVNVIDRSQVLAASVQAIKQEFGASDFQMGMLSGLPFAIFYSLMGIPIAAWADRSSRRNVLVIAVGTWSAMTALFGTAVNFTMLFLARIGTAIGEAGGSPPSHSLISDYFPKARRGTAFAIYALAVPIGTSIGAAVGGWGNQNLGWRNTFIAIGLPGVVLALIVFLTVKEPPRGMSDGVVAAKDPVPPLREVFALLLRKKTFLHMTFGCALIGFANFGINMFMPIYFNRVYDTGSFSVVSEGDNRIEARFVDCVGFDRNMWTEVSGSIEGFVELAGGRDVSVRITEGGHDEQSAATMVARWSSRS